MARPDLKVLYMSGYMDNPSVGHMLADLVASTFVEDPLRRQRMLEESSLNQRLRLLITYLQDEIGSTAT